MNATVDNWFIVATEDLLFKKQSFQWKPDVVTYDISERLEAITKLHWTWWERIHHWKLQLIRSLNDFYGPVSRLHSCLKGCGLLTIQNPFRFLLVRNKLEIPFLELVPKPLNPRFNLLFASSCCKILIIFTLINYSESGSIRNYLIIIIDPQIIEWILTRPRKLFSTVHATFDVEHLKFNWKVQEMR